MAQQSYYKPAREETSLFDMALQTGARAIAGQMVGDFFETVPPELTFASGLHRAQISTMEAGETDGISELQSLVSWIDNLGDVARVDALNPESTELKDAYGKIYKGLTRLGSDQNIEYYDISETDPATGKPLVVKGFSQSLKNNADIVLQRFEGAKHVFDHINTTTQDYGNLRTEMQSIRDNIQTGPDGKFSVKHTPYQADATNLNKLLDDIANLHAKNNIYVGGRPVIGTAALKKAGDETTDWARADAKLAQIDYDPTMPGIQVAKEQMKLTDIDLDGLGVLEKDIVSDLQSNNFLTTLQGSREVTYDLAAQQVQKYIDAGEPVKAMAIMDRMLPQGNQLKKKKEIAAMLKAQRALTLAEASSQQVILNKRISYTKAEIDTNKEIALDNANKMGVQMKQLGNSFFGNMGSMLGGSGKGFGLDQEERTRMLGLIGTDEWEIPPGTRPFIQMAVPFISEYNVDYKYTGTTGQPDLIAARFYRNRQANAAPKLLKLLAWAQPAEQKIVDINGKSWKLDEIDAMDKKTAYDTLKSSKDINGMLWLLGFGAGDKTDMTDSQRAKLVNTRAKSLSTVEPGTKGWTSGSPEASAFTGVLEGAEGKTIVAMAQQWNTAEGLLDAIVSPKTMKDWERKSEEIEFMQKVLSGFYGDNNLLTDKQRLFLKTTLDGKYVSDGKATIAEDGTVTKKIAEFEDKSSVAAVAKALKDTGVHPKLSGAEYEDQPGDEVDEVVVDEPITNYSKAFMEGKITKEEYETARKGSIDLAEPNLDDLVSLSDQWLDKRAAEGSLSALAAAGDQDAQDKIGGLTTLGTGDLLESLVQYVSANRLTDEDQTDLGDIELEVISRDMDGSLDEYLSSTDERAKKLTNNKVLMSSLSNLSLSSLGKKKDITVTPVTKVAETIVPVTKPVVKAKQDAVLDNLAIESVVPSETNIMDRANLAAPKFEKPSDKRVTTREELVDKGIVDSRGREIDFTNPVKFAKQVNGIVEKIKQLNKSLLSGGTKNKKSITMEAKYWIDVLKQLDIDVESLEDIMQVGSSTYDRRESRLWKEAMDDVASQIPRLEETARWTY